MELNDRLVDIAEARRKLAHIQDVVRRWQGGEKDMPAAMQIIHILASDCLRATRGMTCTPGDWEAGVDDSPNDGMIAVGPAGMPVCHVEDWGGSSVVAAQEARHNVSVIVAAPRLLAFAQRALESMEEEHGDEHHSGECPVDPDCLICEGRRVIADATKEWTWPRPEPEKEHEQEPKNE